jgi:hypothetical protein
MLSPSKRAKVFKNRPFYEKTLFDPPRQIQLGQSRNR